VRHADRIVPSGFWVASQRAHPDFDRSISAFMEKTAATSSPQPAVKELVVLNKMGIHARPAAMIVRITNKFKAEVLVEKDEEQVNGKSIMGLMMLAAGRDSKVKFIATGSDAEAMLTEIEALFAKKFDEA
jgi:phosphocarrier protein HPr